MKEDLVKIIARLYTLKEEIEDSNNRHKMELDETIDELERMVLDYDEDVMDIKFRKGGIYPWHNDEPHEEEG